MRIGPDGVAGHLAYLDCMLNILCGRIGDSRDYILVAALNQLADKTVLVGKLAEHAAGSLDLLDNLGKCLIAQFPVAFPGFQAINIC